MSKWRNRPHWVLPGVYLGSDEWGDWVGYAEGSRFVRPGAVYVSPADQVGLVPATVDGTRPGFLATFHARGGPVAVYVDVTTPAEWDGTRVCAVDLDLDVIRGWTGRVWVDDEDEFARHRTSLGYPPELVAHATESCDRLRLALLGGAAPFDGSAEPWLTRLAGLRGPEPRA